MSVILRREEGRRPTGSADPSAKSLASDHFARRIGVTVDIFTKKKRSEVMSRIRSTGNKTTEIALAGAFRTLGVAGWRRHLAVGGYRPDFVFRREKIVVFVDGCFWHSCPVHFSLPASNRDFWLAKLKRNEARDLLANSTLRAAGWNVLRFWEHEIKEDAFACAEAVKFLL